MHEEGLRQKDIAAQLDVARCTVARYVQEIEADVQVQRTPAGQLTEREVARLKFLARTVHELNCPKCGQAFIAAIAAREGDCPHCNAGWAIGEPEQQSRPPVRSPLSRGHRSRW
jgi:ribosomal protein L37AE/L43A